MFHAKHGSKLYTLTPLPIPTVEVAKDVAHHVLVVDRSGSMCGDMEAMKRTIEHALIGNALNKGNVETTLISFSSQGDVILHWHHVPAVQLADARYTNIVRSLRATSLTGMSQALDLALQQVKDGQTTGITLFTDGYANDPSAWQENQRIDAFVAKARSFRGLFLNAVGYRDWCDWPRLNAMTNALSGRTIRALSFTDVYNIMHETQALLTDGARNVIELKAGIVVAVNWTTGAVNVARDTLRLAGAAATDDVEAFGLHAVTRVPKTLSTKAAEPKMHAVLALALLALQDYAGSKAALFATGNKTLWNEHQAALTPSSVAAMVEDVQAWIRNDGNRTWVLGRNTFPKHGFADFVDALRTCPPGSVSIPAGAFYRNYRRRSIKKLPGKRAADGTITPPRAFSTPKQGARLDVRGVSYNRHDASVQLETAREIDIYDAAPATPTGILIPEVMRVSLRSMKDFRSFTLISSGERNLRSVPLEINNKAAFNALKPFATKTKKPFKPGATYEFDLAKLDLAPRWEPNVSEIAWQLRDFFVHLAEVKLYSAMLDKVEASPFTPEQVEALAAVHVSPKLYFNPPTHDAFKEGDPAAVAAGVLDSFTRNIVQIGTVEILGTDEFRSGNEFLRRRYVVKDKEGNVLKAPTLLGYHRSDTYELKPPGKAKHTAADVVMARVFDDVLLHPSLRDDNEWVKARLESATDACEAFYELMQPLVMLIGCTGVVPSALYSEAYNGEDFECTFNVSLKDSEKEGMFFVGDLTHDMRMVISIRPETVWYTP